MWTDIQYSFAVYAAKEAILPMKRGKLAKKIAGLLTHSTDAISVALSASTT